MINKGVIYHFNNQYWCQDTNKRIYKKGSGYERFLRAKQREAILFGITLDIDVETLIANNYDKIRNQ